MEEKSQTFPCQSAARALRESMRIPAVFKPLLCMKKRIKLFYGGRAGGKSYAFADSLLIKARRQKLFIVCVREIQNSIKDSVHKLLSDRIKRYRLTDYRVTELKIENKITGSVFIFKGLRDDDNEKIKSLEGADIAWIEEGQCISKKSWEILEPTIRKSGSEIWISMNRKTPTDPLWIALSGESEDYVFIRKVNYTDNPFCPQEMIDLAHRCREKNPADYRHIWLGEPSEDGDEKLIPADRVSQAQYRFSSGSQNSFFTGQPDLLEQTDYSFGQTSSSGQTADLLEQTNCASGQTADLLEQTNCASGQTLSPCCSFNYTFQPDLFDQTVAQKIVSPNADIHKTVFHNTDEKTATFHNADTHKTVFHNTDEKTAATDNASEQNTAPDHISRHNTIVLTNADDDISGAQSSTPILIGLDIARFGNDASVFCFRQNNTFTFRVYRKKDTVELANLASHYIQTLHPHRLFLDIGGVGAGVYDLLLSRGFYETIRGVNFGERARLSHRYANRRAEMWDAARACFQSETVYLENIPEIYDDLCAVNKSYDKLGRLLLEEKSAVKRRLGRSPDWGDALALTFAEPCLKHSENLKSSLSWEEIFKDQPKKNDW